MEAALTRDGGPCPHCLNVIPGEDAATDPGVAQRARDAAAQAASSRSRRRRSILLGAVVLLSVAGGIGYSEHQRRQQYAVLELSIEWDDFSPTELAAAKARADAEAAAAAAAEAAAATPVPTPRRRDRDEEVDLDGDVKRRLEADPDTPVDPAGSTGSAVLPLPGPGPIGPKGGPGPVVPIHELPVLVGQAEIDRMVKKQMNANKADIKRCYEGALLLDDTLSGRWTLEFVILPSGATDQIKVTGDRMKSERLESCFAKEVRGWTFQRIDKPMPVSYSVPLGT